MIHTICTKKTGWWFANKFCSGINPVILLLLLIKSILIRQLFNHFFDALRKIFWNVYFYDFEIENLNSNVNQHSQRQIMLPRQKPSPIQAFQIYKITYYYRFVKRTNARHTTLFEFVFRLELWIEFFYLVFSHYFIG